MADSGSKTEKATPKRKRDERKKGNAFTSKDIISVASILIVFYTMKFMFPSIYGHLKLFLEKYMDYAAVSTDVTETLALTVAKDCIIVFVMTALPILIVSILVSVVATGAQTRFLYAPEALKPKWSRISLLQGFKRMLSVRSLVEVIKGILKITIIGVILYRFFMGRIMEFTRTIFMDVTQSVVYILDTVIALVLNVSIIFVIIAAMDFLYQWWDYERQLKMSKQEVKEEYKQTEGDPQVKGKIRDIQRKFAMSRMMQAVPTADVIIRNPTHFAVALKYDLEKDAAPMVVAKGQDQVALRIVRIGEENGVFITENKPLARAIFDASEVGREIPIEYYGAVAEIIALLYRLKNKTV